MDCRARCSPSGTLRGVTRHEGNSRRFGAVRVGVEAGLGGEGQADVAAHDEEPAEDADHVGDSIVPRLELAFAFVGEHLHAGARVMTDVESKRQRVLDRYTDARIAEATHAIHREVLAR